MTSMNMEEEKMEEGSASQETQKKPCWEKRGCEGLMGLHEPLCEECPHSRTDCYSPCPTECKYTNCQNPWHKSCFDINLVLDTTVDRHAAIKQACYTCEFFLKHGPRIQEGGSNPEKPVRHSSDSDTSFTLHMF